MAITLLFYMKCPNDKHTQYEQCWCSYVFVCCSLCILSVSVSVSSIVESVMVAVFVGYLHVLLVSIVCCWVRVWVRMLNNLMESIVRESSFCCFCWCFCWAIVIVERRQRRWWCFIYARDTCTNTTKAIVKWMQFFIVWIGLGRLPLVWAVCFIHMEIRPTTSKQNVSSINCWNMAHTKNWRLPFDTRCRIWSRQWTVQWSEVTKKKSYLGTKWPSNDFRHRSNHTNANVFYF